jgi:tRNA(Ile)-lysidine synthase
VSTPCVAVAYSGGRDSTALLHATIQAAGADGLLVLALHVHHGLSEHADGWLAHAEAQCRRWADEGLPVRLLSHRLQARPHAGESVEAWARQARYRALRQMALEAGASIILLAHHRRDQAETLLLQAFRGAGVAGLAGMPGEIERDGITWVRPWLDKPREAVEAYLRQHRLSHIEDDSNADARFARNRLRLKVWPALVDAFPQVEASLADAATWASQASDALDELAAIDLKTVASSAGLNVKAWHSLSSARRVNVLRAWLKQHAKLPAPASLVQRLCVELHGLGSAQWPLPSGSLRRHRGHLKFLAAMPALTDASPREPTLSIRRAGNYKLPGWGGHLSAMRVKENGVPLAWLAHLELRARVGGEQFQMAIGRPPRSLKKQYQAANVPAWNRDGPLVYSGDQLIFVPGLGLDARVLALPGQAQMSLQWQSG